ncbi:SEFIR domain-containing protein, partial [Kibdelosporangium lantanae]
MGDERVEPAGSNDRAVPRVFVTYSHDSPEHKELVLRFCTFLRAEAGLDVHLDRWYEDVRRDWSLWAIEQLAVADFVVVIASPGYRRRVDGWAAPDEGRGAQFEGAIIRDNLTRDLPSETRRVLPVVLPGRSVNEIPAFLHGHSTSHYVIPTFTLDGASELLAVIAGVARHPWP